MAFDLRTHIRDPKSGRVTKVQPYRLRIGANGERVFERDGRKFYENGVEILPVQPKVQPEPSKPDVELKADPVVSKVDTQVKSPETDSFSASRSKK